MSISNIESGDRRLDVLGLLDLRIMPLLVIPQHLLERVLLAQSSGYPRRGIAEKTKLRLSNNTVLITGGATGIGYAMAEAFLESGSAVAICGRKANALSEARAKHPELQTRVCDVSKEDDRRSLVDWAAAQLPALNVLINNAGTQRDVDFTKGIDDFISGDNEIRVNLEAVVMLSGLFVPLLTKNKGAAIVNVSSGLGFIPAARMPVYSATKAGLHAFSMALRLQLST